MAVSKRTRFEVFRRDEFTCRYCRSADNPLTIDHVVPTTLGGSDEPDNLVAACRDCNAGKGSTSPDEHMVAQVDKDAIRWAAAMEKAAEITAERAAQSRQTLEWFMRVWQNATWTSSTSLPHNWADSILRFMSLGLTRDAIEDAVRNAAGKRTVDDHARFRYFAGICWSEIRELQAMAREIVAAEDGAE